MKRRNLFSTLLGAPAALALKSNKEAPSKAIQNCLEASNKLAQINRQRALELLQSKYYVMDQLDQRKLQRMMVEEIASKEIAAKIFPLA